MKQAWALLLLGVVYSVNGCASGNWLHFRAERYEAADRGDERVIRAATYDVLVKAQKLSAKGQHVDALDLLHDLEGELKGQGNAHPNERALTYQAKAYVLMTMGRMYEAAPAIELALQSSTLPEQTTQDLRYNLAQIYVQQEKFKKAAPVLEQWISQADNPEPEALALLGYIYYQDKRYAVASEYTERALRLRPDQIDWRKILLSCQYERKQYDRARETLLRLIGREPMQASHWRSLSQLDLLLDQPEQALVSLDLAQDVSALSPDELLQLVRLSLVEGIPQRAVSMLSRGLESGKVKAAAKHLRLLAHAQLAAKNLQAALEAFEESQAVEGDLEEKCKVCLRMAGLAMRLGDWARARRHAVCAAQSVNDTRKANAKLIEGVASYQMRDFSSSLASLAAAEAFPVTQSSAAQWAQMVRVQQENIRIIGSGKAAR